jgi:hypothetical protein
VHRLHDAGEEKVPLPTVIEPWTGMTLVELPPGRFTMGSDRTVAGRNDDETLHEVEITLDRNVVADVQARVRRSPVPPAGP